MLYNRFGGTVVVSSFCGMHVPQDGAHGMHLLRAIVTNAPDTEHQSARATFVFAENIRADNGWREVLQAIDSAAPEDLSTKELRLAILIAS